MSITGTNLPPGGQGTARLFTLLWGGCGWLAASQGAPVPPNRKGKAMVTIHNCTI